MFRLCAERYLNVRGSLPNYTLLEGLHFSGFKLTREAVGMGIITSKSEAVVLNLRKVALPTCGVVVAAPSLAV